MKPSSRSRSLVRALALLSHVAVAFCGGCAAVALGEPEAGKTYVVTVDPTFSAVEREELVACGEAWRELSSGRVSVAFADGDGDLALERRGPAPGGYVTRDRVAWVDADGLYREGFDARTGVRATCMNLVGQFFGVELHGERGALSREDVVPYFTVADRNACEAAGRC